MGIASGLGVRGRRLVIEDRSTNTGEKSLHPPDPRGGHRPPPVDPGPDSLHGAPGPRDLPALLPNQEVRVTSPGSPSRDIRPGLSRRHMIRRLAGEVRRNGRVPPAGTAAADEVRKTGPRRLEGVDHPRVRGRLSRLTPPGPTGILRAPLRGPTAGERRKDPSKRGTGCSSATPPPFAVRHHGSVPPRRRRPVVDGDPPLPEPRRRCDDRNEGLRRRRCRSRREARCHRRRLVVPGAELGPPQGEGKKPPAGQGVSRGTTATSPSMSTATADRRHLGELDGEGGLLVPERRQDGLGRDETWKAVKIGDLGACEGKLLQDFDGDGLPELVLDSWEDNVPVVIYRILRGAMGRSSSGGRSGSGPATAWGSAT